MHDCDKTMRNRLNIYHSFLVIGLLMTNISCIDVKKRYHDSKSSMPNIVFFLVDDLGWTDLGCYGSTFYETPNIDKLSSEGLLFTDAYAASPVCSPTRASILTGKYPCVTGTTNWFGAPQPDNLPSNWNKFLLPAPYVDFLKLEEFTVAEALKKCGYSTFIAGKWHLGESEVYWPENQGFDINKGGYSKGRPHKKGGANGYFSPYGNPRLTDGPVGEYLTERLTEETLYFIEEHVDTSFFVFFSFYNVHTPLMAEQERIEYYENKKTNLGLEDKFQDEGGNQVRIEQCDPTYAAMVEAVDLAVGRILTKLKTLGIDQNTIIFFMSDNGGLSTAEGAPTSNSPLRAGKGWLYEGGIREPLIVKWQGITAPGSKCNTPIISTDFYPTILEMISQPVSRSQKIDGASLVPLLKGLPIQRGPLFWHYPHYGNQGGSPASAIRDGDWKLVRWYENDKYELFNLKIDIGETKNLVNVNPEKAQELKDKLQEFLDDNSAKYPKKNL